MCTSAIVTCAVEGPIDEAVLVRLAEELGCSVGPIHGKMGKGRLDKRIDGYNSAARFSPWLVLRDMDRDDNCPLLLRQRLLASSESMMCFRIAVRSVESWLLADHQAIARFLKVSENHVPQEPESLHDPKITMVDLARRSRSSRVKEDMVPRQKSGRSVGPLYTSYMIDYIREHWRPNSATKYSESLNRAIRCWQRLLSENTI